MLEQGSPKLESLGKEVLNSGLGKEVLGCESGQGNP
ncbi:hypothetical protein A2U01_0077869, partial [Trifolium medium]|nr:hypothetical protein [Trifolium medium]